MAESQTEFEVVRCWGCEKIFDKQDASFGHFDEDGGAVSYDEPVCPFCGVKLSAEGTEVKTVEF